MLLPWANQLTALERELGPTSPETPKRVAVVFGGMPTSSVRRATTIAGVTATLALLVGAGFWLNWRYQHTPTPPSIVKLESTDAPVRMPRDSGIGRNAAGAFMSRRLTVAPSTMDSLAVPESARRDSSTSSAGMPRLLGSAPPPKYPRRLRQSRVEGDVLVQFVVDEQGHPAMASFTVVHSPHRMLTSAVRDAVARLQFEPARTAPPALTPKADTVNYAFTFHAPAK